MKNLIEAHQLRYRKVINIVKDMLSLLEKKPMTDIRVYPEYPFGWSAEVGVNPDKVYIFTSYKGQVWYRVTTCRGFAKNGSLMYDS